jgi:hypothetical protein
MIPGIATIVAAYVCFRMIEAWCFHPDANNKIAPAEKRIARLKKILCMDRTAYLRSHYSRCTGHNFSICEYTSTMMNFSRPIASLRGFGNAATAS